MHSIIKQKGYSLVELVIAITITAIISTFSFSFISIATKSAAEVFASQAALNESLYVHQKIESELSRALPNSIRITENPEGQCLEFIPVEAAGFYESVPDSIPSKNITLRLNEILTCSACDKLAAIYPVDTASIYSGLAAKELEVVDSNINTASLSSDSTFTLLSPEKKIFITSMPVAICQNNNVVAIKRNLPLSLTPVVYDDTFTIISDKHNSDKLTSKLFITSPSLSNNAGITTVNGVFGFKETFVHIISEVEQNYEI